jgi:CBS domain-containing protein
MSRKVVVAHPADSVATVARQLAAHGISAVPVVDAEGKLLGMVSEGDIMRPFGAKNQMRRAWWLEMLAEGEDLAPDFLEYIKQDNRKASDLMTRDVIGAPETATVGEIADLLTEHHVKRVPVLKDGHVVGIVSRADIVRALAQHKL